MTSHEPTSPSRYVLTLSCADRVGIVHAVSSVLVDHDGDIREAHQFGDPQSGRFFQRVEVALPNPDAHTALRESLARLAEQFGMDWDLRPAGYRTKVLILTSKAEHCLRDLLFRAQTGDLPIEVVGVVSNHPDHEPIARWHGIEFHHVPVTAQTKPDAERALLDLVERTGAELVILARYMQILSDQLTGNLAGRCINIHHSFLPSFKGARPYHQAHARGVKMIGATAHYVNSDLDEGPIIAQHVLAVNHGYTPAELAARGRDAEVAALTDAVRWHCEGRVFVDGRRTVVLR
ncbi:formyltetrahydrofolate deformylase [Devriesea agamarum]|uniref:formyltetrahydrofolate deformylase n=1 Tax=Devriesea agamarum TaxID=472569 RepID=UPI00071CEFBF|nr:formyltetrahydrofolate deformylase [Devriesea agamarum]